MIPDDVVDEVRSRADIVDLIGESVPLVRSGKEYKGSCPFHDDRSPSFYVVPAKAMYHCFGCGESGDVFTFVMKRAGVDFVEAVKRVGGRFGIEVREVSRRREEDDPRRPLFEANAFARDFFRRSLSEGPVGERARAYLDGRGIGDEVAERFGLGYAPPEWRGLRDAAARHGIDDETLLSAGLITRSDRSQEPYDRFRDRVVFPITSLADRVVAFGGRILESAPGGAPKYLNSPETPLYQKSEVLYGLAWARNEIRRHEVALVVEGYMDVVSLAAAGVANVVATLGTAMTEAHAALLKRFTTRVLLLFDSDAAGLKATFRAGDVLLAAGLHPAVVTLPDGEDPDSLVRARGGRALTPFLEQAVDVLDRKIQILDGRDYFSTIERTRSAVDRLLPTLRAAADPTLRDIYVERVSARTGVRRETLEAELGRSSADRPRPTRPAAPRRAPSPVLEMGAERALLLLLVKNRGLLERAGERVGPQDFQDFGYRRIFELLTDDPDLDAVPAGLDPGVALRLEKLLASSEEVGHASQVLDEAIGRIKGAAIERQLNRVDDMIRQCTAEDELRRWIDEKVRLTDERRQLGAAETMLVRRSLSTAGENPREETNG